MTPRELIEQQNARFLVRDYLRDSRFHEKRIAEMIEEAKDDSL